LTVLKVPSKIIEREKKGKGKIMEGKGKEG
jgi:hypothetical protein